LPPGSYVAVIAPSDGPLVRAPFVIGPGERIAPSIALPTTPATPADFIYVPEGDFFYGSNRADAERRSLEAQPMHRLHGRAFWISRTEVTFEQWLAFLRALPPAERRRVQPSVPDVMLEDQAGRFRLTIEPSPNQKHSAREGEPLEYPERK